MYEDTGDLEAACDAIQDVHVETYGSLSKREKAEYILEQIRVTLLKKDYIRVMIHSRKMNLKTTEEAGFEDVKIRFYRMMIEYYMVEKNTWEIAQAYYKIASTPYVPTVSSNEVDGAVEMKHEQEDVAR
jgi:26S proteasome regulatory subunit N5